jgi:hypothetical protein
MGDRAVRRPPVTYYPALTRRPWSGQRRMLGGTKLGMNFLDVRTVIFSQIITNAVCTAVLAFLWIQNRKRFAGTPHWLLDLAFQTTAVLLIVWRGRLPDRISMAGGSTLVVAEALLGYLGLMRFVERSSPQIHTDLLLAVFVAVQDYFAVVQPNLETRNLNMSLALLILCSQCAWLALRQAQPDLQRVTPGVGLVYMGFGLISAVRAELSVEGTASIIRLQGEQYALTPVRDIMKRKLTQAALAQKVQELERFIALLVDRELRMIELKNELNAVLKASAQPEKYRIAV